MSCINISNIRETIYNLENYLAHDFNKEYAGKSDSVKKAWLMVILNNICLAKRLLKEELIKDCLYWINFYQEIIRKADIYFELVPVCWKQHAVKSYSISLREYEQKLKVLES